MYIQDNIIKITYACSATEEEIQKLIDELKKNLNSNSSIDTIYIYNDDIPISLLVYIMDLLTKDSIVLYVNMNLANRLQKIIDAELFQQNIRILQ